MRSTVRCSGRPRWPHHLCPRRRRRVAQTRLRRVIPHSRPGSSTRSVSRSPARSGRSSTADPPPCQLLEQAEETAEAFGRLVPLGDLVRMDDEGFVYVDHQKVMIISGGENIYCAEMENTIAGAPYPRVAVIGRRTTSGAGRSLWWRSTRTRARSLVGGAHQWLRDKLAGFKRPKHLVVDELPRNASSRVVRAHCVASTAPSASDGSQSHDVSPARRPRTGQTCRSGRLSLVGFSVYTVITCVKTVCAAALVARPVTRHCSSRASARSRHFFSCCRSACWSRCRWANWQADWARPAMRGQWSRSW